MKIGYLSGSIIPSKTANSVQAMRMCQGFCKNDHEVILFARESKYQVEDVYEYYGVTKCFNIVRHKWPRIRGIGGLFYSMRVFEKIRSMGSFDLFYGRDIYSLLRSTAMERPVIYEAHTPPANRVRYVLEVRLLRNMNLKRIVFISEALRREYSRIFPGLSREKMLVSHDAADPPDEQNEADLPESWPGRNGVTQVGYVGHLYPGKGVEIIVELASRMANIDFHVVGGTGSDIMRWQTSCHLKNCFFHGFVPHGRLSNYFAAFDILLAPYQEEVAVFGGKGDIAKWMSPLKIFEYMAHGKAIVASKLPVLCEILRDGENSLLCDPCNIDEWHGAIAFLVDNPDQRNALGREARDDLMLRYTWQRRAEAVIA